MYDYVIVGAGLAGCVLAARLSEDPDVRVLLVEAGEARELRAEREVILSAGSDNTPQLLMLSGIGIADELTPLGIAPVLDLPVGTNLQDHNVVQLVYLTDTESIISAFTPSNQELLEAEGRGPLSSNLAEAGGFLRTRSDLPAPDIQIHGVPGMIVDEGLTAPFDHAFSLGPTLLGLRAVLEMVAQPALLAHQREPLNVPASDSDADLMAWLEREVTTIYQPAGTCAIGSVVDPELRVLGIENLRVVDASVMPTVVSGNTNTPTIMIGEKAADMIRGRSTAALGAADATARV